MRGAEGRFVAHSSSGQVKNQHERDPGIQATGSRTRQVDSARDAVAGQRAVGDVAGAQAIHDRCCQSGAHPRAPLFLFDLFLLSELTGARGIAAERESESCEWENSTIPAQGK